MLTRVAAIKPVQSGAPCGVWARAAFGENSTSAASAKANALITVASSFGRASPVY